MPFAILSLTWQEIVEEEVNEKEIQEAEKKEKGKKDNLERKENWKRTMPRETL